MRETIASLSPVAATVEPSYPSRALASWKQVAAALGVSAALLLPACFGDLGCEPRLAGDVQPVQDVRTPGTQAVPLVAPAPEPVSPKKPLFEEPVVPEPEPRLAGIARPATLD